jgi:hypothetical protein
MRSVLPPAVEKHDLQAERRYDPMSTCSAALLAADPIAATSPVGVDQGPPVTTR